MNQAALPMITSSPLSIWFTFSIEIFYQYALYGLFVSFACTYVNLQNIQMFTGIYIYVRVCVCVCVHVSERLPIKLCCNLLLGGLHAPYFWSSMICNHFLQTKWRLLAKWRLILPILFPQAPWYCSVEGSCVQLRGGHFETSPLCTTFWPLQKNVWSPWCFARSVWGKCCTNIFTVAQT